MLLDVADLPRGKRSRAEERVRGRFYGGEQSEWLKLAQLDWLSS